MPRSSAIIVRPSHSRGISNGTSSSDELALAEVVPEQDVELAGQQRDEAVPRLRVHREAVEEADRLPAAVPKRSQ